jgi:mRNA interferase RelE/StbE
MTGIGDIKHLAGRPGRWRLRVGDYRVVMEVTEEDIQVVRVGHRREVYRD